MADCLACKDLVNIQIIATCDENQKSWYIENAVFYSHDNRLGSMLNIVMSDKRANVHLLNYNELEMREESTN